MARITPDHAGIAIELTTLERIGALHGDVRLRTDQVVRARVSEDPFAELRGVRAPGTGVPRRLARGTWRHREGKDLVLLRRGRRAVVLDLADDAPFRRVLVGTTDPERIVAALGRPATNGIASPPEGTAGPW
jgi:hypothetical protein